jgi:hypothetical protein
MPFYDIMKLHTDVRDEGAAMPDVLFTLIVLTMVGTLLCPLVFTTRGRAIWGWVSNFMTGGMIRLLIQEHYPAWAEPAWYTGLAGATLAWMFVIVGLVIALRRPRKRIAHAA